MMIPPSAFPLTDPDKLDLYDGLQVATPDTCHKLIAGDQKCVQHYKKDNSKEGEFKQCPFGFTTRRFSYFGKVWFVSGVIAHPRFGTAEEQAQAKKYPASRVTRSSIDSTALVAAEIERARADAIADGAKVLPQAFHELRKLNGTIMQHAERAIHEFGDDRSLLSIKSAAELMRNNFDILEALSNIEGMRSMPLDGTVNLFDLAFKMKRVYQEKAAARTISISVGGVRAIIKGSQKSFPLVPAVLLENAIKYGVSGETVLVVVREMGSRVNFIVENSTIHRIDPVQCFERGARYAVGVEGGGFGLFLAKEVVEAHNGTIACEFFDRTVRMVVDLPLTTVIS